MLMRMRIKISVPFLLMSICVAYTCTFYMSALMLFAKLMQVVRVMFDGGQVAAMFSKLKVRQLSVLCQCRVQFCTAPQPVASANAPTPIFVCAHRFAYIFEVDVS